MAKTFEKWPFGLKSSIFDPPGVQKAVKMNFREKKQKRHVLTLPKTKFHAKNQKNLLRGFPGKLSERERDRQRETDPNIRVLRTLSLSRRTKKNGYSLGYNISKGKNQIRFLKV